MSFPQTGKSPKFLTLDAYVAVWILTVRVGRASILRLRRTVGMQTPRCQPRFLWLALHHASVLSARPAESTEYPQSRKHSGTTRQQRDESPACPWVSDSVGCLAPYRHKGTRTSQSKNRDIRESDQADAYFRGSELPSDKGSPKRS